MKHMAEEKSAELSMQEKGFRRKITEYETRLRKEEIRLRKTRESHKQEIVELRIALEKEMKLVRLLREKLREMKEKLLQPITDDEVVVSFSARREYR